MTAITQNAQSFHKKLIRDARGHRLALQTLLGRGTYGKVYRAEDEETGEQVAVKFALSEEDLGEGVSGEQVDLYGRLLREAGDQLASFPATLAPPGLSLLEGPGNLPCMIQVYTEDTLLERLHAGVSFADLCTSLAQVAEALEPLHAQNIVHGNLRPGNILFFPDEGGSRVCLSDPLTSLQLASLDVLEKRTPGLRSWLPPEIREQEARRPLSTVVDTYALARLLFEAIVEPDALKSNYSGRTTPYPGPLDKRALSRFKSALEQRLVDDNSNPHVRPLLVRKASALMTRALSQDPAPSPPYRFYQASEVAARLTELRDLFHPGFEQLGMLLLDPTKASPIFEEGEEVKFSVAFRCHGGIEDEDLIICMTYVRDLEADMKVKEPGLMVLPSFDGSRFRFNFILPKGLPAGRYLLRVALAIKGSPGKPTPRDLTIEVKAAPGKQPLLRAQTIPEPEDERHVAHIPLAPAAPPRGDAARTEAGPAASRGASPTRDEIPAGLLGTARPADPRPTEASRGETRAEPRPLEGRTEDARAAEGRPHSPLSLEARAREISPEAASERTLPSPRADADEHLTPRLKPNSLRLPPREEAGERTARAGSSEARSSASRDSRSEAASREDRGSIRPGRESERQEGQRTREMTNPRAAAQAALAAQQTRETRRPEQGKDYEVRSVASGLKPQAPESRNDMDAGVEDDWFRSSPSPAREARDDAGRDGEPGRDGADRKRSIHTAETVDSRRAESGREPRADGRNKKKERSEGNPVSRVEALRKLAHRADSDARSSGERRRPTAELRGRERGEDAAQDGSGGRKPGERFIPELYYKVARATPQDGEEEEDGLIRSRLQPYHELILVGVLLFIFLTLVAIIVYLLV